MKKKGFLVFTDGEKYACNYMLNGKHVAGDISDDLLSEKVSDAPLPQLELEDGTLRGLTGAADFQGHRDEQGKMLMKKFSSNL